MSKSLTPHDPALQVKHTNVSSPSVVHRQPSQQSISASEDYYSLSGGSERSANIDPRSASQQTITRYQTPPSRYRTPQQSRDYLPQQHATAEQPTEEMADSRTPMMSRGMRRQSSEDYVNDPLIGASSSNRDSIIRRKPVPDIVMDPAGNSPPKRPISPENARSSMARKIGRENNAPTPDVDDRPFIEFALEQLTRDEEVRGSRTYAGYGSGSGIDVDRPFAQPVEYPRALIPTQQIMPSRQRYEQLPQNLPQEEEAILDERDLPPPRSPRRLPPTVIAAPATPEIAPVVPPSPPEVHRRLQGPNLFVPVAPGTGRYPTLRYLPGSLRPLSLVSFAILVVLYLSCLIIAAVWSLVNDSLVDYGRFGDGLYFVFKYLPALVGMVILIWLMQIQTAVYRVAPFIAMASSTERRRDVGATLPLQPKGFVLPYFGHFRAGQPAIGLFMFVAWFSLFTIPLLSSSFNVYFAGAPQTGQFRWIANQGPIWAVIGLYLLLLIAVVILLVYLSRSITGLKWDPRSLADLLVLLERSNALEMADAGEGIAQLGLWHTIHRPSEIFQTYGIANQPAREYAIEEGRIQEKIRYSDPNMDLESGRPQRKRWSKVAMLHDHNTGGHFTGHILPWYLRPSLALLWPVISIVLLIAFLIVSYLPATSVRTGFPPLVSASVDNIGFSSDNFLYSFLPTALALLAYLLWSDIDMAYRRLQPYATLSAATASTTSTTSNRRVSPLHTPNAEQTLLTSYPADWPVLVTLSALFNTHLRVALTSTITLLSTALPVLASGIFWAQFSIPQQRTLIYAHMPGYYALTVFVAIYAFAYLAVFPPASLRHGGGRNGDGVGWAGPAESFADVAALVARSKALDDVAFREPRTKTVLVTRLLAGEGEVGGREVGLGLDGEGAASKVSLADSVRGFGRARGAADGVVGGGVQRFGYGRFVGRDGREWIGIDRMGR